VAVGSLTSIFGSGLAGTLASTDSAVLSTTLSDVDSVTINGQAVPLVVVSDSQINAQVPWETVPGQVNIAVNRRSGSSSAFTAQVTTFAPALMSLNLGRLQALATNSDATLAAPANAIPGLVSHPAKAGGTITLLATGLGPVSQATTGRTSPDGSAQTTALPVVLIGGIQANVISAGLSQQYVGVYQVQVVVPDNVPTGSGVPVQIQAGGVTSSEPATIAIQ
jgi:uncharacterized protein (TIGR03437 family)